jgi:hypothetical protein
MALPHRIFVFGSNLAGKHGKGAALHAAKYFGAIRGEAMGRTGNAYAIPTKGKNLEILDIKEIAFHAKQFIVYAKAHSDLTFQLTPVGTGLAKFTHDQMAPLFKGCPPNVLIPKEWESYGLTEDPKSKDNNKADGMGA